jgi:hypothetical protein
MNVGRRRFVAPLAFLTLACFIGADGPAHAQGPPMHHPDSNSFEKERLTTEQLKDALLRFDNRKGFNLNMPDAILKQLQDKFKESPEAQERLNQALKDPATQAELKKILENPAARANFEKGLRSAQGGNLSDSDIQQLLKKLEPLQNRPGGPGRPKMQPELPPRIPGKQVTQPQPNPTTDIPNTEHFPKGSMPPGAGDNKQLPQLPGNTPLQPPGLSEHPEHMPEPPQDLFGKPGPVDPRTKTAQALADFWERNIGPLDETPEVKKTLFDLLSKDSGLDFDLKDESGKSLWDLMKQTGDGGGDGSDWSKLFDGQGSDWKGPDLNMSGLNLDRWFGDSRAPAGGGGGNRFRPPAAPRMDVPSGGGSFSGFGGLGGLGGGGSWLPVAILAALLLAGLGIWWWLARSTSADSSAGAGAALGAWPLDPKSITSREDVVKAFEYLSVLICGPAAKVWTHGTIASALSHLAVSHEETAMKLARLYELARYAPFNEPLSRHEIIEARSLVCDLAGVS